MLSRNLTFRKPYVKFQEYWSLVRATPDANKPSEIYSCTYLVDWTNQTIRDFEGPVENARLLFEDRCNRWKRSVTCEAFTSQFCKILNGNGNAKVTKIICFGLGDLNVKPPDWWRIENNSQPKDKQEPETSVLEGALMHHAIALTIADVVRSSAKTEDLRARLLTQDPHYSNETKHMLRETGFEVIGDYGAGGFAELDDMSIVFSPFTKAPVKQIIADIARPAVIVSNMNSNHMIFNQFRYGVSRLLLPLFKLTYTLFRKPYADPESPRTRHMWEEYESSDFPAPHEGEQLEGSLHRLAIYARIVEKRHQKQ